MSEIKLRYALKTSLMIDHQCYELDAVLHLLNAVQKQGNLRAAANSCGYSYRKAWNRLKELESQLGLALVEMQRGRGTQLSTLGQQLVKINQDNEQRFNEQLGIAANQATTSLQWILSGTRPLRIVASDSEILDKLRQQDHSLELHFDGSGQALAAYFHDQCDAAGFHIAAGINQKQFEIYNQYLNRNSDRFVLLEQRRQGLMSRPERPVDSFQQIVDQNLIFVNRQCDSGTRLLLDRLLKQHGIKPEQLKGYYHEEHTHLAVASLIASSQADAGLGVQSVASRLKLYFLPVVSEYYFLVFKAITKQLQQLLDRLNQQHVREMMSYSEFLKTLDYRN